MFLQKELYEELETLTLLIKIVKTIKIYIIKLYKSVNMKTLLMIINIGIHLQYIKNKYAEKSRVIHGGHQKNPDFTNILKFHIFYR